MISTVRKAQFREYCLVVKQLLNGQSAPGVHDPVVISLDQCAAPRVLQLHILLLCCMLFVPDVIPAVSGA